VTVTFAAVGEPARPRVAYAVGRHVGTAVARNRLRRRLRAAVDQAAPVPGAYLVGAGHEALELEFDELRSYVSEAMAAASRPGTRGPR
jgi:ribonuclease P protein component